VYLDVGTRGKNIEAINLKAYLPKIAYEGNPTIIRPVELQQL
jgi:hypothetical protein